MRPSGVWPTMRVEHLLRHRPEDLGPDEAGRDGGDADLVRAQLARPGGRHVDHGRFGRGVIALAEVAVEADDGRRVEDDAAALRDHVRRDGARAVEDAFEVHVDDEHRRSRRS